MPSWKRSAVVALIFLVTVASIAGYATLGTATETVTEEEYELIVIFRNDDLQPYYRTETMRAVDRIFVEEEVAVTQGVIPAIGGEPADPDGPFCTYLRKQARDHPDIFEFSLHGYDHRRATDFYDGSEFGGLSYAKQRERIDAGVAALEACTNSTPTTFIPPFNTYDETTAQALAARDIHTVSGGDWFTNAYYGKSGVFETNETTHVPSTYSFVGNWTTNELRNSTTMETHFDRVYENRSTYVQMLHYPTFDTDAKRDQLRSFVRYVKRHDGVAFMTLSEFAAAIEAGDLRRTADGWTHRTTERTREPFDQFLSAHSGQAIHTGRDE